MKQKGRGKRLTAMALAVLTAFGSLPAIRATETDNAALPELQAELTASEPPIALADTAYDVTPPVIEKVTLEEDGQTVEPESELHFLVNAYDAESEIDTDAYITFSYDSPMYRMWGNIQKMDGGYLLTVPCPYTPGKYSLQSISLYDTYQNRAEMEIEGSFTVSGETVLPDNRSDLTGTLTLSDTVFTLNNVDDVAELGLKLTLDEDIPDDMDSVHISLYTYGEGYSQYKYADLAYDTQENAFVGTLEIDSSYKTGEWKVSSAYAYGDDTYYNIYLNESKFTLENAFIDITAPIITDIAIDKQGEFVSSGDVVFTIKAEDDTELRDSASLQLFSPLNDQIKNPSQYVQLTYDKEKGAYIGSINVDDLYPCEWYIENIYIFDAAGNYTNYYGFNDEYANYFYVKKSGGEFVQKVYQNITFNLTLTDGKEVIIKNNVTRRATLEEVLGKDYFDFDDNTAFGKFLGWERKYSYPNKIYTKNTQLIDLSNNENLYFNVAFENKALNVNKSWLEDDGSKKTDSEILYVERNTTYRNLLELLPDLSSNTTNYKFKGWKNASFISEDSLITNNYVTVYAVYDKYPFTVHKTYLGENGEVKTENVTKDYPIGTTVTEALEDNQDIPKDASADYKITGWTKGWYEENAEIDLSYNDGQLYAVCDKYPFTITKAYLDKNGNYTINSVTKDYLAGTTIKEILADNQDTPEDASADYKITGWTDSWLYDKNTAIGLSFNSIRMYAVCDKYPFTINKTYLDKNGEIKTETVTKDYLSGTTMGEVLKDNEALPKDASDIYPITGWRNILNYSAAQEISINNNITSVTAAYENHAILSFWGRYVDQDNKMSDIDDIIFCEISDLKSTDAVIESINSTIQISHAKEFGFKGWKVNYTNTDSDRNIYRVSAIADYEKCVVVLGYINTAITIAANPGDIVTLPETQYGWYSSNDGIYITNTFTVPEDANGWIWLYTEDFYEENPDDQPSVTPGEKPSTPDDTSGGTSGDTSGGSSGSDSNNTPSTKPVITMDDEKVEEVISDINKAVENTASGTTPKVTVDMRKEDGSIATEIPKELLAAAQGKDVDIVLNMGGYTWTINGKDIKASDLKDINLEVTLDTDEIPPSLISNLAGGQKTRQLTLTHNGDFGFKATLTLPLGAENAGQYGNLYYYDSNGKLIFMNAGQIDADGNVSLTFSHASDYVIVIGKDQSANTATSANTGDVFPILPAAMLCIGLGFVSISCVRRKRA